MTTTSPQTQKISPDRGFSFLLLGLIRHLGLALFLLGASDAFAQSLFPFQIGSAGQEYGKCAAKAPDGSLVFGILFQNTVDFEPGTGVNSVGTPPGIDCAIAKYDPSGALRWVRGISGSATGTSANVVITPHGITTDASGNVIVIGYFGLAGSTTQATVDFDPGPGVANLTNTGGWDPFIWKLDANGNFLWARTFGSTTPNTPTDERAWDVAADAAGAIYVSGFIHGTYDLDAGVGVASFTSAGEKDAFLVKYDVGGNYVWGFTIPDTGDTATSLKENSVCLDGAGHVFLAGHFNGTADFDPVAGVANLTSAGNADMFIARYNTNGEYQMAVRIGNGNNDTAPPGSSRCDAAGNLYMAGKFRGTLDLNPGAGVNNVTNSATTDNIWVASFTNDLAYRWGFSIVSDNGLDGGHRVDFDPADNGLYLAGWFSGATDFDGGAGSHTLTSVNNTAGAASDVFLAKYDRDTGTFAWARGFGGIVTNQTDLSITAGLAVDDDGAVYVTGQFYGTGATFYDTSGPQSGAPAWNSLGSNDAYIIKYSSGGGLWNPTTFQEWRQDWFFTMANAGIAANGADSDGDGLTNLMERALGLNPTVAGGLGIPTSGTSDDHLAITFTRGANTTDLTYLVEATGDLAGSWTEIYAQPGVTIANQVTVSDTQTISGNPRRFLRLKVTSQ